MINQSNYFSEISKIGVSNLTPTLAQGHTMLEKITKNGSNWNIASPTISTVVENQLKLINAFKEKLAEKTSEAETWDDIDAKRIDYEAIQKGKAKPTKAFKQIIKAANKTAKPPKPAKKVKTVEKPEKAVKVEKPQTVVRKKVLMKKTSKPAKVTIKAPVTVRKFSLELQHLKRYLNMEGRSVKTESLVRLSGAISKAIALDSYLNHKTLLNEINGKLSNACEKLNETGQGTVDVKLTPEFKAKCRDIISSAKVRVRTEYLAGTDLGCDCEKKK